MQFPTRSGVLGIICASLGLPRGSQEEREFLASVSVLKMQTYSYGKMTGVMNDYHTIGRARCAIGVRADAIITNRDYLTDAKFAIVLSGDAQLLDRIANALGNPVWSVGLGRKSCIPSAPIFTGMPCDSEEQSLAWCKNARLIVEEVPLTSPGDHVIMDVPVSFNPRVFVSRKVRIVNANFRTATA
jgi:CRISPR system Cascade subunit CasD